MQVDLILLAEMLHLQEDIHIIRADVGEGRLYLALEAFADGTFPSFQSTAVYSTHWDVKDGEYRTRLVGWSPIDEDSAF